MDKPIIIRGTGLDTAYLLRRGYFEEGYEKLALFTDSVMQSILKNQINKLIDEHTIKDLASILTNINESFDKGDYIKVADILEYEIGYL